MLDRSPAKGRRRRLRLVYGSLSVDTKYFGVINKVSFVKSTGGRQIHSLPYDFILSSQTEDKNSCLLPKRGVREPNSVYFSFLKLYDNSFLNIY
jgi:hypothetical protein